MVQNSNQMGSIFLLVEDAHGAYEKVRRQDDGQGA